MAAPRFDVLGIGNAIVDVIARTDDDFLVAQKMQKGGMALIDEARATAIYDAMGPATQISGGSAANTIAGVASFGARGAFVGKVKDDEVGRIFRHDITKAGVTFETKAAEDGPATARCYIMVTPDGERTMNTFSRRRAESASERHRRKRYRRCRDHLSRRLSVGSEGRERSVPESGEDRAWRQADGGAHLVRRLLRRPLSRRVCQSPARRGGRSSVRQRSRAEEPVRDRRFRYRGRRVAPGRQARRGHAQRKRLRRCLARQGRSGAGCADRRSLSTRPAPAICSRPDSWSASRAGAIM